MHFWLIIQMCYELISVYFYLLALIFKLLLIQANIVEKLWKKRTWIRYNLTPVMFASLISE